MKKRNKPLLSDGLLQSIRNAISLKILFGFTLLILLSNCSKDDDIEVVEETQDEEEPDVIIENLTIPATTTYFNEAQANNLINTVSNDGTITMNKEASTESLEANDILLVGISDNTPAGLLKKITTVNDSGNELTFTTTDATLDEAIKEGTLEASIEIDLADVDSVVLSDGVTEGRIEGANQRNFPLTINTTLEAGVVLQGSLSFTPTIELEVGFSGFSVSEVNYEVRFDTEASLAFSASASASVGAEKTLGIYYLKPIPVGIIVIVPKMTVKLGADGQINVGLETMTSRTLSVGGALSYSNGTWTPSTIFEDTYVVQPLTPVGTATAELALKPSLELLIYGLVGPSINTTAWVKYDADLSRDPCWMVTAGLEGNIGINLNRISSSLSTTTADLAIASTEIARSESSCQDPGFIEGLVRNAVTQEGISGVLVTVNQNGNPVASQMSESSGTYRISAPVGEGYSIEFTKDGFIPVTRNNIDIAENTTTFIEAILQIDDDFSGLGNIGGKVSNAITGAGEPGVTLEIRNGLGSFDGNVIQQTVTDDSGFYEMQNLEAGNYTIEANKEGFFTAYFSVLVLGEQTTDNQNGTIAPETDSETIRIVLDWGSTPRDLDSHFTGPSTSGGRFHCYFSNRSPSGSNADLDVDDTSGFGPETITLSSQIEGTYRYSVHDYTNRSSDSSTGLAGSQARVRLILGNGEVREFYVPTGSGTLWTVFELQGSNIVPINTMSFESSPGNITGAYRENDAFLISQLPAKN